MSVHLFTLSDVRLSNGAEAPLPLDLDHPERVPDEPVTSFESGWRMLERIQSVAFAPAKYPQGPR